RTKKRFSGFVNNHSRTFARSFDPKSVSNIKLSPNAVLFTAFAVYYTALISNNAKLETSAMRRLHSGLCF
ncbi:MAG: hypothetical protein NTV30_07125, partial [Chloroflexi bacterium]|nr:hypothetical protein [Chloroflexota bacterium]